MPLWSCLIKNGTYWFSEESGKRRERNKGEKEWKGQRVPRCAAFKGD